MAAIRIGKVCGKHVDGRGQRYESNNDCIGCVSDRNRRRRIVDPAKERERVRAWRSANRTKVRGQDSKRKKDWLAAHPGKAVEYTRRWQRSNPAAVLAATARRRARKRKATVRLTAIERARVQEAYSIAVARTAETGIVHHVHHDKPLALGGLHHPDNLLVVTAGLNLAMGDRYPSTLDFLLS